MKFARISDNTAVEVATAASVAKLGELFHPSIVEQFVAVPNDVEAGWTRVGNAWTAPADVPAEAPYDAIQLALIDFLRLFTTAELAGFNALRKACQAISPADYQAAAGGDQAKMALVGFEVFLTFYDALRNGLIELNQPQTIQGLQLLVPLGVLTAPRLAQVLANEPPE